MKIRTLLIDGSSLLKRSFHGAKNTYNSKGTHIGAIYQFLITTRKLIKEYSINKVVVMWDGEQGGKMRYLIDKNYKANRPNKDWHNPIQLTDSEIKREQEKEESILFQRICIKNYLENLFIRQLEVFSIEADDLIAQYCISHNNLESIHLFTNDRDFAQLLDLNITILFANIPQPITKANYCMHFDHHYSNALMMKIIGGDVSDNIKGIKGIKEDILLKYFPDIKYKKVTVNEICKQAKIINEERINNKLKPLKIFENLLNGKEILKVNYKLTNLREPFLNEEAYNELEQLEMPLSPENRGSKNLYKMMVEDEFLTIYGSTFVNFVEPFYTIIMNEKQLLYEYDKKLKNNL